MMTSVQIGLKAVAFLCLVIAGVVYAADSNTISFDTYPIGPLPGGVDARSPGDDDQWWVPDNAATFGEIQAGVGRGGSQALVIGNRGNNNDGVIANVLSPQLLEVAGEGVAPVNANVRTFSSSYWFRTVPTTPVTNFRFRSETWGPDRTTFLGFQDNAGDLVASAFDIQEILPATFNFVEHILASGLTWGAWYKVVTEVTFFNGPDNDRVSYFLYDASDVLIGSLTNLHSWEEGARQFGYNGGQIFGVNAVQYTARDGFTGEHAYVDDLSYSVQTTPITLTVDDSGGADFTTIQAAIAAAASGDTIEVLPGNYATTGQITIDKDLIITGTGETKPVVQPTDSFTSTNLAGAWFFVEAGVAFDLSNMVLDGGSQFVYQAIRSHGNTTIDGVDFRNIVGSTDGIGSPYRGYAVSSHGGTVAGGVGSDTHGAGGAPATLTVSDSTFNDIGRVGVLVKGTASTASLIGNTYTGKGDGDFLDYAFELGAGGSATITGNTISDNRGVAAADGSTSAGILLTTFFGSGTAATINNNQFINNTDGIHVGFSTDPDTSTVTAYLNQFTGNTTGVFKTAAATGSVDATGNWWGTPSGPTHASNVGGTGDPVSDGVIYSPWLGAVPGTSPMDWIVNSTGTIQAAIDAAAAGDIIQVGPGTYTESLVLGKSLSLLGPNAGISPNTGTRGAEAVITGASPLIEIPSSANVDPLTIDGFTFQNAITGATTQVLHVPGATGDHDNVTIINNRFLNNSGRLFISQGTPRPTGWLISDNLIDGMTQDNEAGMQIFNLSGFEISNNVVRNTTYGGIQLGDVDNGVVTNNTVEIVPRSGIQLQNGSGITISANAVSDAGNGNGATATNTSSDDLTENGGITLYNTDQSNVTILGNILTGNFNGITVRAGALLGAGIIAHDNSITGSTNLGIDNQATGLFDATNNWWGDPSGPGHATNPGSGNAVSDGVVFSPWCGDAGCGVLHAIPTQLVFTAQPGGARAGDLLSAQPVLRAQDGSGNLGFNFNGGITLALNPAGVLGGTNPVAAVNGVASFSDLVVLSPGTFTLTTANGAGLTDATSDPFAVTVPPGIAATPISGLVTTEAGGTASFQVVLQAPPTADVSIGLSTDDATEGTPDTASLVFTNANWDTPQTVTVTGVDDDGVDGDVAYHIVTAAAVSGDGGYAGLDPANVSVTNNDNDTASINVNPTAGLITTEAGGTTSFNVVLTSEPAADVTIGINSSDLTEGLASPSALTFTAANWDTPQTVTITGVDDADDDGDVTYTIVTTASSTDAIYGGINPADVAVTNTDDDEAPDDDGLPPGTEEGAPNGGDGNNDGMPDAEQGNVASFPDDEGDDYLTLESPAGTQLENVEALPNPAPVETPAGVDFPERFVGFQITGLAPGASAEVVLILHSGVTPDSYWKYGPTTTDPSDHFYEFAFDGATGAEITGNQITLHFVDGGRGDADLLANGVILDPGAPSVSVTVSVTPIPSLNDWGLALLSLLISLAGWGYMRLRQV